MIPPHLGNTLGVKVVVPEWFRVREAADYSSLSSTELFRLCINGEIESIHKLKPGQSKGVRLIRRSSLDEYLQSFLPGGSRYRATVAEIRAKGRRNAGTPLIEKEGDV